MALYDSFLYSRGTYWLFEHWNEDGGNIYSKSKYDSELEFLKGAGKLLSAEQLLRVRNGTAVTINQEDGTKLFFKYVNLP